MKKETTDKIRNIATTVLFMATVGMGSYMFYLPHRLEKDSAKAHRVEIEALHVKYADVKQGLEHIAQGEYGNAVPLLKKATTEMPNNFVAHYNLGIAYQEIGQHKDSLKYLTRALEIRLQDNIAERHKTNYKR